VIVNAANSNNFFIAVCIKLIMVSHT
jgi:hypothetical protein